ncbi:hypothetical protein BCD_1012 (plasmid) [Borrelia crocidurae DOU]|uniref:Uncharacterized protein n=1 Tax=Borrelia crocidurae DOU TaxID=1293575 RepID=W5SK98_9SPIR|nr:hypothetical protein BCD_1012 [Borrelia crocidurae DOU]
MYLDYLEVRLKGNPEIILVCLFFFVVNKKLKVMLKQ